MDIRALEPRLHVSAQIRPEDLPSIAALGYRALIGNRPDGEAPDQPTTESLRSVARALGLDFVFIPVRGSAISPSDINCFTQALNDLPQPILGFCRTGTRTTTLWALSQAQARPAEEIIAAADRAGYDLEALRPRLEEAAA